MIGNLLILSAFMSTSCMNPSSGSAGIDQGKAPVDSVTEMISTAAASSATETETVSSDAATAYASSLETKSPVMGTLEAESPETESFESESSDAATSETASVSSAPVDASAIAGNPGIDQVPHKPKGVKTRINVKPVESEKASSKKSDSKTSNASGKSASKGSKENNTKSRNAGTDLNGNRFVAVKTNAIYWAAAVANLAAEVQLHKNISLELPLAWSLWDIEREHGIRLVLFQPEARWWMKGVGNGHFVGVNAGIGAFNVKWNEDRYQTACRPLLGAGITYGYSLPFSEHWGAEFMIGAGYANMKYDRFYNIDNGAKIDTGKYNYWGITRLGISLVYRF